MRESASTSPRELSTKRRGLGVLVTMLLGFLVLELVVRITYGIIAGPQALFYGFRSKYEFQEHTVAEHEYELEGYSKYFPNESKIDSDPYTGEAFRVTINSKGFRGRDFEKQKKPGIIRVVTLGASSTFGYYDRDDETYPVYMEQELNEQCGEKKFEVINLGIPHSTSGQLLSLFHQEALPLDPDVVTYYQGMADISTLRPTGIRGVLREVSILRTVYGAIRDHLIVVSFTDSFLRNEVKEFSEADFSGAFAGRHEDFFDNVSLIHEESRKRGIHFMIATQQAKSYLFTAKNLSGVTYEKEVDVVRKKLAAKETIDRSEALLLAHAELMDELRVFAAERDIPLVDIIEALDQRRDVLVSFVHISPEGNRIIAKEFAERIREDMCHE